MGLYPQLNFPPCHFRVRSSGGTERIWDDIRRMWLVLTPEEWVRRHVVQWLIDEHGVLPQMIRQEHPVDINGQPQRADIVVFRRDARPLILVECKEAGVTITAKVYAQAVRYNAEVCAHYLMITNGIKHYVYEMNESGDYMPVKYSGFAEKLSQLL